MSKKGISDQVARLFEIGLLLKDHIVGYYSDKIPFKFLNDVGIIFPVKNLYGDIVSVYLRRLSKEGPKYDSLPFEKNILFGLHKTFPFIYKQGAILVEGPFDVFVLMSHGIHNVCALLGTNINIYQISLLRRFTDKCYIVMDGDPVGRSKGTEIRDKLASYGFETKLVFLPVGYDPDSYVKQYRGLPL